jgi:hypothetical protein
MVRTLNLRQAFHRVSYGLATLVLIFLPLSTPILADADSNCTPPSGTGVNKPVGADASLYTYNCDTGLWVSSAYNFNPSTGQYTPINPTVYTYDTKTGMYDYTDWQYNASQNKYLAIQESVATPPSGTNATDIVGAPIPVTTAAGGSNSGNGNSISNTGSGSDNSINDNGGVTDGSSIDGTGANSNNNIDGSGTNVLNSTANTNANVTNNLTASAATGDTTVLGNTEAGDSTSGDAEDIANVTNMLQSASNALGGNAVTFVANINGNVNGDLMLDPNDLSNVQSTANPAGTNTTNIVNNSNESINNNLNLGATSGNATVADNTQAGDATSGAAKTIANVVNLIDSAVTSGKSFLGVININGNLNGDILMPSDFVNQLLAANTPTVNVITSTGSNSSNTITDSNGSNNTNVNNNNNETAKNTVNSTANTGAADVSGNTEAGNATSGTANTDITAFNLTGSKVVGKNDILVFVNVVGGKWVGLILNAPAGTTAAELGGGVTTDSTDSNNNTNVNNNSNQQITNNLNLNSTSGNAKVDGNTKAGNATSGNADNAVNLLNVENSSLSLSNWFGILFINVFGTWNGSFGINTSAGDPVSGANSGSNLPGSFAASPAFSFRPSATNNNSNGTAASYGNSANSSGTGLTSGTGNSSTNGSILTAAKNSNRIPKSVVSTPSHLNWSILAGGTGILAIYLAGEHYYAIKQRSNSRV